MNYQDTIRHLQQPGKDICFPIPKKDWQEIHCHDTMPECDHCGAHVSERFARVFTDERGRLSACPNCSANAGIAESARERSRGS